MENENIEKFTQQHKDTYRQAIIDNIKNNTDVLVDQDIVSLLKKPPLDSMDLIRTKFLDLAKKNKIVLNTEELGVLLDNYREFLLSCCDEIKDIRVVALTSVVEKEELNKSRDTIKINKADFIKINKKIKKLLKERIIDGSKTYIIKNIDNVFAQDVDSDTKTKIIDDISKFIDGRYQKQIMESVDIKILVKDTTLMNGTKEQGERYLFTLDHSRLLNEIDS